MKTKEEIINKIDTLKKGTPDKQYEIWYLEMALVKDEKYLNSLLSKYEREVRKYEYELAEDKQIIEALSWVLK